MLLITQAGKWSIFFKARLIGVNTRGEEAMLVAKSEGGIVENFGMFLRNIPHLEFLNSAS